MQDSLKSRNKIYKLARTEPEIRVNDYNPLLLLLWKANIDIQFVAESSLALVHYVSGYITKAERSNMHDIWQEVSENTLCNVKLFTIDEISMVSSLNLAYMHMRLEELFGEGEWFGSRNMMFVVYTTCTCTIKY